MQIGDLEKRAKEKGKAAFAGVIVEYGQEQFRYWIDKDAVNRDHAHRWLAGS